MDKLRLATMAVEKAQGLGAYASEAYVLDAASLSVTISEQQVDTLKFSQDVGIGVRVISNRGTVGFAFTTDLTLDRVTQVIEQAMDNSKETFADNCNILPLKPANIRPMILFDEDIKKTSIDEKIMVAKQIEASAKSKDSRVKKSEKSVYQDAEYQVFLANSLGTNTSYRAGYCGIYGVMLAEQEGDVQTGMALQYSRNIKDLNAESVGNEAALDAVRLLGANSINTTRASLVLSPYIATNFFSILIPSVCADAVQKGRSLFSGKIGHKVFSPLINLVDDGTLPEGIASSPIDGEGVSTERTEIIVDGVLNRFLYNTYTGKKDKVASTGNGVRNSFKSVPGVSTTNIFIKPGNMGFDKLIGDIQEGFYVTNVMGMHTANPITGDFSVGASGVWIKNGEFAQAVRGVAIAGNILDLFSQVEAVGDDLRFFGSQGAPTIRISSMTISGS